MQNQYEVPYDISEVVYSANGRTEPVKEVAEWVGYVNTPRLCIDLNELKDAVTNGYPAAITTEGALNVILYLLQEGRAKVLKSPQGSFRAWEIAPIASEVAARLHGSR